MKKLIITILVLAVFTAATPALASTITGATYKGTVTITNTSTATARVAVPFTLSTQQMIDNGYILANCTNTAFQVDGADVAYQPAGGTDTTWALFYTGTIPKGTAQVKFYTGGAADMGAKIRMFPGSTGYGNVNALTISSNTWEIEIKGWFDLSQSGNIVNLVNGADHITVTRASGSSITGEIHAGANSNLVTAGTLSTTAEHTIKLTSSPGTVAIYWDGILKDSIARTADFSGINIPAAAGQWDTSGVMPYMEFIKVTVGGALKQHTIWENSSTVFSDQSGNGNTVTPTFRSTSSDSDVSAAITGYEPITTASAGDPGDPTFVSGAPSDISGGYYNEGNTAGIPIAPLVDPALSEAQIPKEFFWYPIAFAIAIAAGFAAFGYTRQLIVQGVVSCIVYSCFAGGGALGDGLLPWIGTVLFAIETLCIVIIQEKFAV